MATIFLSPTEDDISTALRAFLLQILPAGVEVFLSQENYVPEPATPNFCMFTPLMRAPLETPSDSYSDVAYTASIADDTMTVAASLIGAIVVGQPVFGVGVADGTTVTALGSGMGGAGTYTIAPAGQTVALEVMAGGGQAVMLPTQLTTQLDFHGPLSPDNLQIFLNLWRDPYAVDFLAATGVDMAPFYAGDGRQVPFNNAEANYETRWTTDAIMQVNAKVVGIPQQFAADLGPVNLYEIDAAYPAS